MQGLHIVFRWFENKVALNLIGAIVIKCDNYPFQRIVFLLFSQAQLHIFDGRKRVIIIGNRNLVQSRVKQLYLLIDQFDIDPGKIGLVFYLSFYCPPNRPQIAP